MGYVWEEAGALWLFPEQRWDFMISRPRWSHQVSRPTPGVPQPADTQHISQNQLLNLLGHHLLQPAHWGSQWRELVQPLGRHLIEKADVLPVLIPSAICRAMWWRFSGVKSSNKKACSPCSPPYWHLGDRGASWMSCSPQGEAGGTRQGSGGNHKRTPTRSS